MSSIIPVGRNKSQVHQGCFKHESILNDNSLFNSLAYKTALDVGNLKQAPKSPEEEVPNVPEDLQSAMNEGGLDPERGMPKEPDMGGPEEIGGGAELGAGQQGAPQQNAGSDFEQTFASQYGPRVSRIVANFLKELREAEMMSSTFSPDPQGTKFTIGGGGLELKVPAMQQGAKLVEHV